MISTTSAAVPDSVKTRVRVDDPRVPLVLESTWKFKPGANEIVSVAYEDISGTLDTGREPVDLASRAGFIKPNSFSYQSEYRFALGTIGEPSVKTLRIPVSDALRECTSLL